MNHPPINRLKGTALYFSIFGFFLLIVLLLIYTKGKNDAFLFLNDPSVHDSNNDTLFKYLTYAGDGWFAIAVSLMFIMLPKTQRLGIVSLSAYASSGLLAQLIKRMVESPRPGAIFTPSTYHYFIKGEHLAMAHSFPSGHTTTAFAMAIVLASFSRHKWLQINFLFLAILVGYSRIYLGQHFPTDVLGGAVLGTSIGTLTIFLSDKIGYKKPVQLFGKSKQKHQFHSNS